MSLSQPLPLSADANKGSGVCSVCFATRQLHLKDGTIHKHGPRSNPCPGSHKAPLCSSGSLRNSHHSSGDTAARTGELTRDCQASSSSSISTQSMPPWVPIHVPVIKHIPKSARSACASHLSRLLRNAVANPRDDDRWVAIFSWTRLVLANPKRGGKRHNVATSVKKRLSSLPETSPRQWPARLDDSCPPRAKGTKFSLSEAIASKMEDGNIRAAVRLLCSEDKPASASADTLAKLRDKHPQAPADRLPSAPPLPDFLSVEEADVFKALRSFPAGSSGGPDRLRPKHLLDLVRCKESGAELLTSLTATVNLLLSGTCSSNISSILFGGRLIALDKKSGGIRPIAVGFTLRRLASKCANAFAAAKLSQHFAPRQLGAGVRGGCEAAVHATRRFLSDMQPDSVLAKLDFANAFNCLHRDAMLNAVMQQVPEIFNYCRLAYSHSSILWFDEDIIWSEEGPQQGDPLGPLLFCCTVQPLLSSLQSSLVIGFMDDFTLGGAEGVVEQDVTRVLEVGANLGLHLNVSKCELIHRLGFVPKSHLLGSFKSVLPGNAELLGAPLLPEQRLDSVLDSCCTELSRAIDRLSTIESHDALILLRACFSAPKIQHILRCTPCHSHRTLQDFDELLKSGLCIITNCDLSDLQWLQACLPVRDGGLGIRRSAPLALSAFLASAAGTSNLQDRILANATVAEDIHTVDAKAKWSALHSSPVPETSGQQSVWDKPHIQEDKAVLWSSFTDDYNIARLAAVSAPHSSDWLFAMPVGSCGLRLDNEAVRVAVGLRLGLDICVPHECPCGEVVDSKGTHGLSCKLAFGRIARHSNINEVIYCGLVKANIPSTKEPAGLVRSDGKRPDGLTLIPWRQGKSLTWDVTVVNTVAASYLPASAGSPGSAAEQAAIRKSSKYPAVMATLR